MLVENRGVVIVAEIALISSAWGAYWLFPKVTPANTLHER